MSGVNDMNVNLSSLVQLGNLLSNLGQLNTLSLQGTNMGNIVGNTMGTTASTDTTGDSSNPGPRGLSLGTTGATRHKPGHHTLPSNSRSCEHATGTHVSNTDT